MNKNKYLHGLLPSNSKGIRPEVFCENAVLKNFI